MKTHSYSFCWVDPSLSTEEKLKITQATIQSLEELGEDPPEELVWLTSNMEDKYKLMPLPDISTALTPVSPIFIVYPTFY